MIVSSDLAVVSVTTVNFLHRARALMRDVSRFLPEARRLVCCADSPAGIVDSRLEPFELVNAAELALPRYRHLAFALNATGLCCALKPHIALHAFATGARRVIYLDNDIQLFRRPDEMLVLLANNNLVITPHLLGPVPPGTEPCERTVLSFGIFNAGMFAVTADLDSTTFLRWWGARTLEPDSMQPATGYDQIWLNYAPAFLAHLSVLRDEGYNVAAWNIASRPLSRESEGYRAGAAPLTAFHFSSFDESNPSRLFSPHVRCNHRPGHVEAALAEGYANALNAAGAAQWRSRAYGFGTFRDGRPISAIQRHLFATSCWNKTAPEEDPFEPGFTTGQFRGWRSLHRHHEFSARAVRTLRRALEKLSNS